MPSLIRLLSALAAVLGLFWAVAGVRPLAAVLTFALGVLAFAIIPGMQARVLTSAGAAPTLAVAVNASGFQVAAAFAGWLGGTLIGDGPGVRSSSPPRRCSRSPGWCWPSTSTAATGVRSPPCRHGWHRTHDLGVTSTRSPASPCSEAAGTIRAART